jgi:hypothetical protein
MAARAPSASPSKRSGGNPRAVQEHLRHADIQMTTIYTQLAPQDLQKVVNLFDEINYGFLTGINDGPFGRFLRRIGQREPAEAHLMAAARLFTDMGLIAATTHVAATR